jgi:hypothetical protein
VNDFLVFVNSVVLLVVTIYLTVIINDFLGKRHLKVVMCTITPLHYNVRTGGWTHTLLGIKEIHSYRLRVIIRNPGNIPRGIIDLSITWHLKSDSYDNERSSLNPKFIVAPLINVPAKSLDEQRFVIEIPNYYMMTDEHKPFTITYTDDNLKTFEIKDYMTNPSIRKRPMHLSVHCNTESEGFVDAESDLPIVPDDYDPY